MKVTFLGTGTSQGVPVIGCSCAVCQSINNHDKRLRSSLHIEIENKNLIIDAGPDFRQQVLRENLQALQGILLTHSHKDHIAGLDDVRAFNFFQHSDMPIYGNAPTLNQVKKEFYYAFEETRYPGAPLMQLYEITDSDFTAEGIPITPLPVLHLRMPVLGYRIGDLCYITDANFIPKQTLEKMRGTKILILNALQKKEHPSHFTLQQAIEVARQVNASQTYFTHIGHQMGLHHTVNAELPHTISLAYDGLSFVI